MRTTTHGRSLLLAIADGAVHRLDNALAERAGLVNWADLLHYARELVDNGLAVEEDGGIRRARVDERVAHAVAGAIAAEEDRERYLAAKRGDGAGASRDSEGERGADVP